MCKFFRTKHKIMFILFINFNTLGVIKTFRPCSSLSIFYGNLGKIRVNIKIEDLIYIMAKG